MDKAETSRFAKNGARFCFRAIYFQGENGVRVFDIDSVPFGCIICFFRPTCWEGYVPFFPLTMESRIWKNLYKHRPCAAIDEVKKMRIVFKNRGDIDFIIICVWILSFYLVGWIFDFFFKVV